MNKVLTCSLVCWLLRCICEMWLLGANRGLTLPQQSTFIPVPLSPSLQGLLDLPSTVLGLCRSPNYPSVLYFCSVDVFISKLPLKIPLWPTLFWLDPSLESVAVFLLFPGQTGPAACPSLAIVVFSLLHNYTSILLLEQVSNRSYIYTYIYIHLNISREVFLQFTLSEFTLLVAPFVWVRCSISVHFSLFD